MRKVDFRNTFIDLTHSSARDDYLTHRAYTDLDFPKHWDISQLLIEISDFLERTPFKPYMCPDANLKETEGINLTVNHSSGGPKVRPFRLVHPVIYTSLVNLVTEPDHWHHIKNSFYFYCENSIVELADIDRKFPRGYLSEKVRPIKDWYNKFETRSIELAADYPIMVTTDIESFYPSIDPYLLCLILHGQSAEVLRDDLPSALGLQIAQHIECMSDGEHKGLPVGSPFIDVLAELVLCGVDFTLTHLLEKCNLPSCLDATILRYRDDYRIFCKDKATADTLLELLQRAAQCNGFRLSQTKTCYHDDVIAGSVKPDQKCWLTAKLPDTLRNALLAVREIGISHPNSGSVVKALMEILKRGEGSWEDYEKPCAVIVLLASIMETSPRTYPVCMAIVSRFHNTQWQNEKIEPALLNLLNRDTNSLLWAWAHRIGIAKSAAANVCPMLYPQTESSFHLWNNSWLCDKLLEIFQRCPVVDLERLDNDGNKIDIYEVEMLSRECVRAVTEWS
jgi:RNA-directed DNA polymerase